MFGLDLFYVYFFLYFFFGIFCDSHPNLAYCDYVDNDEQEHPSICIDIDDEISATKTLNAAFRSILPASGTYLD